MIAIANLTTGPAIRISALEAFPAKDDLKSRGYSFTRNAAVADCWLAPVARKTPSGLYDPCLPAWEKEIEPGAALAEITWLEAAGFRIGGDLGIALHNHRAERHSPEPRPKRAQTETEKLIEAAARHRWTPAEVALAKAIMDDPSFDFLLEV